MALLQFDFMRALDASGGPVTGAKLFVYNEGTTTPKTAYSDAALTSAHPSPILSTAGGFFPRVYMAEGRCKVVIKDASDVELDSADNVIISTDRLPNPVQYGGVGDAVTDDTAAIDAVNALTTVDLLGRVYEYVGTFTPSAVFVNGKIVDDNRVFDYTLTTGETPIGVPQGRCRVEYGTATSVNIGGIGTRIALAGFRFLGNWTKNAARVVNSGITGTGSLDTSGAGLAVETQPLDHNWYAAFAVANEGDSQATYTHMPFFTTKSVASNVVTLGRCSERLADVGVTGVYSMATNALVGASVLIIRSSPSGNRNWSGKTTTVTANTNSTITLADSSFMAAGDDFLVAPPGWDDFCYLGSSYIETTAGAPRNMADDGRFVGSRGVTMHTMPTAGTQTQTKVDAHGFCPPLATGLRIYTSGTISTASTGALVVRYDHDSSAHDQYSSSFTKEAAANLTFGDVADISFSREQAFWVTTTGLASSVVSMTALVYGWVEP